MTMFWLYKDSSDECVLYALNSVTSELLLYSTVKRWWKQALAKRHKKNVTEYRHILLAHTHMAYGLVELLSIGIEEEKEETNKSGKMMGGYWHQNKEIEIYFG